VKGCEGGADGREVVHCFDTAADARAMHPPDARGCPAGDVGLGADDEPQETPAVADALTANRCKRVSSALRVPIAVASSRSDRRPSRPQEDWRLVQLGRGSGGRRAPSRGSFRPGRARASRGDRRRARSTPSASPLQCRSRRWSRRRPRQDGWRRRPSGVQLSRPWSTSHGLETD
jgi:hypothetical protein